MKTALLQKIFIANYDGKEIEIGFNSRYVMDILDNLEGKEIKISFNDNSSPIIIHEKTRLGKYICPYANESLILGLL